jgi:putative acetyltransferase
MSTSMVIEPVQVDAPGVSDLLHLHFATMRASSPAESCHVMEPDSLLEAGAMLLAAREGDTVVGVGALTQIGPDHGEVKSMHTLASARGRGVAAAILRALLNKARSLGMSRVSLAGSGTWV